MRQAEAGPYAENTRNSDENAAPLLDLGGAPSCCSVLSGRPQQGESRLGDPSVPIREGMEGARGLHGRGLGSQDCRHWEIKRKAETWSTHPG